MGEEGYNDPRPCPACSGKGQQQYSNYRDRYNAPIIFERCDFCAGEGTIDMLEEGNLSSTKQSDLQDESDSSLVLRLS